MKYLNKKGMETVYYTVIFLVLNLIFIAGMMYFVYSSSNGALSYEQAYAKEIVLFLNAAKPGMELALNFDKGFEIAKGNNRNSGLVEINQESNEVYVRLKSSGGYNISFFTDYNIIMKEEPDFDRIRIIVSENEK